MAQQNTYVVKNMSGTPIFWWVNAWAGPVVKDGNSSQSFPYQGGFNDMYFQVIDDDDHGNILVDRLDPLCYMQGEYWSAGSKIGHHGFTRTRRKE